MAKMQTSSSAGGPTEPGLLTGAAAPRIAVLVPCYNEELSVAEVVLGFREQLPGAAVHVFDNNSTDRTVERAREAGALVHSVRRQGKGHVVQAMFHQVEADLYVMVDGDGTYPAAAVHRLIAPVLAGEADMVVGSRLHELSHSEFKAANRLGNRIFRGIVRLGFGARLTDILSGYRAFSRPFVKGVPLFGGGFEIETELTIKALERGWRILEVPVDLVHRPAGSHSKIRLLRDGMLILNMILSLLRDYKPLTLFGGAGLVLGTAGLGLALAAALGWAQEAHWAAASVVLILLGALLALAGLILHTIVRRFQELDSQLRSLRSELRGGGRSGG
jgi:hypothetical protein